MPHWLRFSWKRTNPSWLERWGCLSWSLSSGAGLALWTGCRTPSCLDLRLFSIKPKLKAGAALFPFGDSGLPPTASSKINFIRRWCPSPALLWAVGQGPALYLSVFRYTKVPAASEGWAHDWFIGLCVTASIRISRGVWTTESLRKNYHHHRSDAEAPPVGRRWRCWFHRLDHTLSIHLKCKMFMKEAQLTCWDRKKWGEYESTVPLKSRWGGNRAHNQCSTMMGPTCTGRGVPAALSLPRMGRLCSHSRSESDQQRFKASL